MMHPVPTSALDDRLGFIGTSGSGKTYNAGTAVEILLSRKARVVIVDPLGVWWGLRLLADGRKQSRFDVAIFGGSHGDLPLTEHAGALIGETAASMAESCIIDLSRLASRSAERRFMVAFLETIYRKAGGEPFHLIVDEADLFAPQRPDPGDQVLLGHMENIVRRGRVKGFIPWLISQRPAVLNKNVLSQVDGLLAFKLMAVQDRDALDSWIEGQADKGQGKAIKDALPTLPIGRGIVWLPGQGILETASFPTKVTFDSSRRSKRGEKAARTAALKPLDVGKLKELLATVEAETKANDPKALRAELASLRKQIADAVAAKAVADPAAVETAERRGYERAVKEIGSKSQQIIRDAQIAMLLEMKQQLVPFVERIDADLRTAKTAKHQVETPYTQVPVARPDVASLAARAAPPRPAAPPAGDESYTRPQMRVLQALAMWRGLGHDSPSREMVAAVAGYSPSSGGFNNLLGGLATLGVLGKPAAGRVSLLSEVTGGIGADEGRHMLLSTLTNPQKRIVGVLIDAGTLSRERVGEATGYSASSGGFNNLLGSLGTLGIVVKPQQGHVALSDWAQELFTGYAQQVAA